MKSAEFLQMMQRAATTGEAITGFVFDSFDLSNEVLAHLNLSSCIFEDVSFYGCKFQQLNLQSAKFKRCTFDSCNLVGVNLNNATLSDVNMDMTVIDGGSINGLKISKGTWKVVYTMGVEAQSVEFESIDLNVCVLQNSDFAGLAMLDCNLSDTRFLRSRLSHAQIRSSTLVGLILDEVAGSEIPNTKFQSCFLSNALFNGLFLDGVSFSNCNLRGVQFSGSMLSNVDFDNTQVGNSNFRGAKFKQVDLRGCDLEEAQFDESLNVDGILLDQKAVDGLKSNGVNLVGEMKNGNV